MILDDVIALIVSIINMMLEAVLISSITIINIFAALIELIMGLFITGFTLGRIMRSKKEKPKRPPPSLRTQLKIIGSVIAAIAAMLLFPLVVNQKITLVAEDGHGLPFAALIVHKGNGDAHIRTDNAGNVTVSRLFTKSITLKDPRYVEQTWPKTDLVDPLIVRRTLLGTGLDKLADHLLKPLQ